MLTYVGDNRGIPPRTLFELGHCCIIHLVIAWSTACHHPRTGLERNISTSFAGSTLGIVIQDRDCPIFF